MGVSENMGTLFWGVLIMRILLSRVLYKKGPYFRKLPYCDLELTDAGGALITAAILRKPVVSFC